jgi:hypothetical protein
MNDEFLNDLRQTWQSQEHDASQVLQRLRRKRWAPHWAIAAQLLGCVFAIYVGVWFLRKAAYVPEPQKLLFVLSAAMMLITVPVLCAISVRARRSAFEWHGETPEALLVIGVRRAETSLQGLRLLRWHLGAIVAFLIVLWVCQVSGLIQASRFLAFYTAICMLACVSGWVWMKWRVRRLCSERDACAGLLTQIRGADGDAAV